MFPRHISNEYAVPTELKRDGPSRFYKHIVPTGLKKGPKYLFLVWTLARLGNLASASVRGLLFIEM